MTTADKEYVQCPVCNRVGVVTEWLGQGWDMFGYSLKCPLCGGSRKVTTEIDAAYWLLWNDSDSSDLWGQWKNGVRVRKSMPWLFPKPWWLRIWNSITSALR